MTRSKMMIGTSTRRRKTDDAADSTSSGATDDFFDEEQDVVAPARIRRARASAKRGNTHERSVLPRMPQDGLFGPYGIRIEGRLVRPRIGVIARRCRRRPVVPTTALALLGNTWRRRDSRRHLFLGRPTGPAAAGSGLSALPNQVRFSGAPGLNKIPSNVINSNNV